MVSVEAYEPINTLKQVADGLWIVDGPIIEFGYLGARFPIPTRMSIIQLAGRGLWVHSPTELTAALKDEVDALGRVQYLIAPNGIHYWWIGDWKRAYPDAVAYAAPGARKHSAGRGTRFDKDLSETPEPEWANEIGQLLLRGSYLTEAVFFHRRSSTLIVTDLIENFEAAKVHSGWLRALIRFAGSMDPDGRAPIDLRLTFSLHRSEMRRSIATMLAWKPVRIILAHGRWYNENAMAELMRAFRWLGDLGASQTG